MNSKINLGVISLLSTAIAKEATCPFGHSSPVNLNEIQAAAQAKTTPMSELLVCESGNAATAEDFSFGDYDNVIVAVNSLYEELSGAIDANHNPRSQFAGCVLRLAGHDYMDFRFDEDGSMSGGSDGCLNMLDMDNKGLPACIREFNLAQAYAATCDRVSLADFIVIAAEAATGRTATHYNADNYYADGTLAKTYRDQFKFGRVTNTQCDDTPAGLLPNPEKGCNDLEDIFNTHIYRNTGIPWTLTAATLGAHTLGSAKPDNSGYEGFWSDSKNSGIFNNNYYHSMIAKGWAPQLAVGGNAGKNQWMRVDPGNDPAHPEMMLNTDLCLAFSNAPEFTQCISDHERRKPGGIEFGGPRRQFCKDKIRKSTLLDATAQNCCTWASFRTLNEHNYFKNDPNAEWCGLKQDEIPDNLKTCQVLSTAHCCKTFAPSQDFKTRSKSNCDEAMFPQGPAYKSVLAFATDEQVWLDSYQTAWRFATENNHENLSYMEGAAGEDLEAYDCGIEDRKWLCKADFRCEWVSLEGVRPIPNFAQVSEDQEFEQSDDIESLIQVQVMQGKSKRNKKPKDGVCVAL